MQSRFIVTVAACAPLDPKAENPKVKMAAVSTDVNFLSMFVLKLSERILNNTPDKGYLDGRFVWTNSTKY